MGEGSARQSDVATRSLPRGRVFAVGLLGLVFGIVLAVSGSGEAMIRWVLIPAALASAGLVLGLLWAVRRERRQPPSPVARRVAPPQPHQLPKAPPAPGHLELGPDPWEASLPAAGAYADERVVFPPDPVESSQFSDGHASTEESHMAPRRSHDGFRLLRPSDHELERARRAVAGMVADLAPPPGAFDAVCERLIAVGTSMARELDVLGRDVAEFEKVLGVDLFDRLSETRVTETGLEVMAWVRWLFAALDEDSDRDDSEFFAPVAVAMASRYGGTSERWQGAIAEPLRHVELGGVVEQIALGVKGMEQRHTAASEPDEVRRLLEAPQWM